MTTNQLFLALLATLITLLGAFYKVLKDYMDAKFEPVYRDLKFLIDHFADHEARLSKLEERTKNL